MSTIQTLRAFEVLDARGIPTVAAEVETEGGHRGVAVVPVGEPRGPRHAVHLVDQEPGRFHGQGQCVAMQNIEGVLAPALRGQSVLDQRRIDQTLCELGGLARKERLGGNATLAVSLAVARAAARVARAPLHQYLSTYLGTEPGIPMPLINVISGGVRAHNRLEFERVMICPMGAPSYAEACRMAVEIGHEVRTQLIAEGECPEVTPDGAFAPAFAGVSGPACVIEALQRLSEAAARAGYAPGEAFVFALDVAANRFFQDGAYQFFRSGPATRTPTGMGEFYHQLARGWPVRSIEDGMADQDFEGWLLLTRTLGARVQIVGGDLFTTHCDLLAPGGAQGLANAVRVHPGQAGTLSETFDALATARKAGYRLILGHQPGATEDPFIADLAVAASVGQIKCGGMFRGEHTSKHNRLIILEKKLRGQARFNRLAF